MAIIQCARPGCTTQPLAGHKWSKIKATEWLFLKSGRAYCPEHWPAWAIKWREEKRAQASLQSEGDVPNDPVEG